MFTLHIVYHVTTSCWSCGMSLILQRPSHLQQEPRDDLDVLQGLQVLQGEVCVARLVHQHLQCAQVRQQRL